MKLSLPQIAPETKKKLIKSLQIGTSGFIVGLIGILLADPRVIAWLMQHPIVSLAVATYIPVIVNGLNEFRKNKERLETR
jgi:hypothetical protein